MIVRLRERGREDGREGGREEGRRICVEVTGVTVVHSKVWPQFSQVSVNFTY